jgi:hypothetical protein
MVTRTVPQSETTPTNGSEPIHGSQRVHANVTDKASQSLGSALETFSTLGSVSQRVGGELLEQGTSAVRDGFETSAKVTGAVLDATKDTFNSFSSFSAEFDPLSTWSRLVDTSAHAYTDYATRLAASAEESTEKIRDAVRVLSDEVQASAARLSR